MKYLPAEVGKKAYQTCPFKQSHFYFIHFLDRRQYTHTHACIYIAHIFFIHSSVDGQFPSIPWLL